jgi:hypothetical protein
METRFKAPKKERGLHTKFKIRIQREAEERV